MTGFRLVSLPKFDKKKSQRWCDDEKLIMAAAVFPKARNDANAR